MSISASTQSQRTMPGKMQPTSVVTSSDTAEAPLHAEDQKHKQRGILSAQLIDLMNRYQQADADAADQLVTTVSPILARYLHSLVDTPRQVEDLLQECWLRIHRARASYRPGEPVLPWMVSIARHTRVDYFRKWQRSSGRESSIDNMVHHPANDPQPQIHKHMEAEEVLRLVRQLPDSQREVLLMMKVADMSVEEVARATGSTRTAVKQKAYRAYQTLRKLLSRTHSVPEVPPPNGNR